MSQPQGHSAAGRIMSTKNSSDTIGNRIRDLPICSAVPQPTALPFCVNFAKLKLPLLLKPRIFQPRFETYIPATDGNPMVFATGQ
jgi:hypothetical protein